MEFHSISDLKEFLSNNPQRIKFSTKVFCILNFTKKYPESINICGAAWCKDQYHFICNSSIIGQLLNLRSNSINTNFRDHGFIIDNQSCTKNRTEFPDLINSRNWKRRSNPQHKFFVGATLEEIERIPCNTSRMANDLAKSQLTSDSQIPKDFPPFHLLQASHKFMALSEVSEIIQANIPNLANDEVQIFKLLLIVTENNSSNLIDIIRNAAIEWRDSFGDITSISIQQFCKRLSENVTDPISQPQLMTNAIALLHKYQMNQTNATFIDYLHFVFHYGFFDDSVSSIISLSSTDKHSSTNSSSELLYPLFHGWFQPLLNIDSAVYVLSQESSDCCWFVSPSEKPLEFILFYNYQSELTYTRINFNPMNDEERFWLEIGEDIQSAPNWGTILYQFLQLDSNKALKTTSMVLPPAALEASTLIKRSMMSKAIAETKVPFSKFTIGCSIPPILRNK